MADEIADVRTEKYRVEMLWLFTDRTNRDAIGLLEDVMESAPEAGESARESIDKIRRKGQFSEP